MYTNICYITIIEIKKENYAKKHIKQLKKCMQRTFIIYRVDFYSVIRVYMYNIYACKIYIIN